MVSDQGHQDFFFFGVPESCWATVRYDNSINADVREDTIKKLLERRLLLLFSDNLAVDMEFLALQDKNNIRTLSVNSTRWETDQKSSPKVRLSHVSKARTNKFYFADNVCIFILTIYQALVLSEQSNCIESINICYFQSLTKK